MEPRLVQLRTAKRRFYDIQSDVMNSKFHNFVNNLNAFVEFCETEPVMKEITKPLGENKTVNIKEWYDGIFKTGGSMVGSKRYVLPTNPFQQASILYQFVLGIQVDAFNFFNFTIGVYGTTRHDDAVHEFVNDIFRKLFRYLSQKLDDIEAELVKKSPPTSPPAQIPAPSPSQVFIVHGHDREMLTQAELLVRRIGVDPIILSDQASEGQTIIEKFEKHSKVPHAIILLSPDDKGCEACEFPKKAMSRARQNVVLELGFFTGLLGRKGVTVLHRTSEDFEMPSDYHGVEYIPYDDKSNWKLKLVTELEKAGFKVDYSKISLFS
jgi:predicted nucleotide-binding protein